MGSSNHSEAHYVAQKSNKGEAKVELLEVETIPETSLNPRIELFVITATNRVILKDSAER